MSITLCTVPIPGPQGEAGTNGVNGANGISSFTYVASNAPAAQPVMPAEGGTVVVNTTGSIFFLQPNQWVYVGFWGYMKVYSINETTGLQVTLLNPEVTASGAYSENAPPGTTLPAWSKITIGGQQGPSGTGGGGGGASVGITVGTGSPEGALTATGPHFYYKQDAPIALWILPSGTGNTGWIELLSA